MLKLLGISALAVTAFVAFMETGSGSAAETGAVKAGAGTATAGKDAKADSKSDKTDKVAKSETKSETKSENKPENKADKGAGAAKSPDADKTTTASKETPGQPRRAKSKRKHDGASEDEPELPPGQGPPPPSPLTVNDLHQEANRDRSPGGEFNAPPRVKLEQLLSEVGKARQSLHDDTLKLEALSGNEPPKDAEPSAGGAPPIAPGAPGQPPQKNPLDVLAKALRGIKPEQAGPIVARLDKGLAATVLLKMPPVDAGKIMAALKPEVAAELATQIAMRAPSSQPGGKR